MLDHPAITQLSKKLDGVLQAPKDDQPAKRQKLESDIEREHADLMQSLIKDSRDPKSLNSDDIQRMRDLEIQRAVLSCGNSRHPSSLDKIKRAIDGKTPCGAFSFSNQMQRAREQAIETPKTRPGINMKAGQAYGMGK